VEEDKGEEKDWVTFQQLFGVKTQHNLNQNKLLCYSVKLPTWPFHMEYKCEEGWLAHSCTSQ